MVVSNKRLKLIYPGCAVHSACEAHVSFKMERGFLCGPGGGQKRSGEGPSGFCFTWGAIKTLIFTHTWCFFCDGGHLMRRISWVIRDIKQVGDSQKGALPIV